MSASCRPCKCLALAHRSRIELMKHLGGRICIAWLEVPKFALVEKFANVALVDKCDVLDDTDIHISNFSSMENCFPA